MNIVLKKVSSIDKKIKKNVGGGDDSFPPVVDQLFKWMPILIVLMPPALSATRRKFLERVKMILLSELILFSMVRPLKKIAHRKRPDRFFTFNSFPSNHTATSFLGAHILYCEAKKDFPALSMAAYPVAVIAAALRVYKKRHWFSDVVAGAIIGMIAARVAYSILKRD
jgi:membrane-associated phospholipid phosphatase